MGVDLDSWIEKLKKTEYLAEDELKALCDYVSFRSSIERNFACCWIFQDIPAHIVAGEGNIGRRIQRAAGK